MEILGVFVFCILLGIVIYFVPTMIIFGRDGEKKGLVFLVNLLTSWTVIGWILCLIWSCMIPVQKRDPSYYMKICPIFCDYCDKPMVKGSNICPHCKKQNDELRFCPLCGYPLLRMSNVCRHCGK